MIEALYVEKEGELALHTCSAEGADVAFEEAGIDTGRVRASASRAHRLFHHVDANDAPPSLRELNRPSTSAASEVECQPVRNLPLRLH